MRWFPLSLLIFCCLATPSLSQGQNKKEEKKTKEEKKERFFGKFVVSKLEKYSEGYDKSSIVTAKGTIVGIFSIKPKKDSKLRDWGMVVRLKVGAQLPMVYLGTYGPLDRKMKPLRMLDEITIRGSMVSQRPLQLIADTLWKKDDKFSLRKAEIVKEIHDPHVKQFSWTKTSQIQGRVTATRFMVPMGAYTGSFVRLGIRQWCYLGSAEYLLEKGLNPQMTKKLTVTGKWISLGNRNVLVAGKIKVGDKELAVRDKQGKLIRK